GSFSFPDGAKKNATTVAATINIPISWAHTSIAIPVFIHHMDIIRCRSQGCSTAAVVDTPWRHRIPIAAIAYAQSPCPHSWSYLARVSTPASALISNGLSSTCNFPSSTACSVFPDLTPNNQSSSLFLSVLRRNSVCNPDFSRVQLPRSDFPTAPPLSTKRPLASSLSSISSPEKVPARNVSSDFATVP